MIDPAMNARLQGERDRARAHLNGGGPPQGKTPASWPAEIAEVGYQGLAGEVVRTIAPHSEADPAGLLAQLLAAYGSACGRHAYFVAEADRHHPNLFALLVGETGRGRKGSSRGHISGFMAPADDVWASACTASGLSSGEGLIWAVRDPIVKQNPIRDKESKEITGYEEEITDPGIDDKRLLVWESEFAGTLKVAGREGNTLSPVVRQAWDGGDLRVLTRNTPVRATAPHISVVGHVTIQELRRELSATETANGFANRFLFVCVKRARVLPEAAPIPSATLQALAGSIRDSIRYAGTIGEMRRDATARDLWHEEYARLSHGYPGMLGAATSRAEAQTMRLAMIYALLDRSPTIGIEHLRAGLEVWRYCDRSAAYVFGDALGDRLADEILRALRQREGGMTRTEIREYFGRNKRSDQIGAALDLLQEYDRVQMVSEKDTGGRPAERWMAK